MSDEQPGSAEYATDAPLPNRLNRGTLLGCAGLLFVLAMPALLFVPLEDWSPPLWLGLLVPLIAFASAALGAWLLARVPASSPMRSRDPAHPLTSTGQSPVIERPAARPHRLAAAGAALLVVAGVGGYGLASASALARAPLMRGLGLSGLAGIALTLDGFLVSGGRLPVPAWRWVRVPVQSSLSRQGAPLVLMGLVEITWALWVALGAGLGLGAAGLALLTLVMVLAAPLGRRASPRQRDDERRSSPGRRLRVSESGEGKSVHDAES